MIYVVTGLDRTGTSMMMRCIAKSSNLKPVVDPEVDRRIRSRERTPGYDPNPNGYWMTDLFPHDCKDGELIKFPLYRWIRHAKPGDYQVVRMVRNEAEREASYKRAFGKKSIGSEQQAYIDKEANKALEAMKVAIIDIDYRDCINRPLATFQKLAEAGWPIDPQKAASYVDPKLYRNRNRIK